MSTGAHIALNVAMVFIAFLVGAWYGGHDRTCVTATAENGATVVYCSSGEPTGETAN